MKSFMYGILALSAVFSLQQARAEAKIFAVGDIAVMQQNADGYYDVVCSNGNRETVTDLDLELGNVCPNRSETKPSGILSLQKRDDGSFDVVCRDFKKLVATAADIMAGKACADVVPPLVLQDGVYADTAKYFCDQDIKAQYTNNTLTKVSLRFVSGCSGGVEMTCKDNFCEGVTQGYTFQLTVLKSDSYDLLRVNDKKKGIFIKK